MSAAATLLAALRHNRLTLADLLAIPERQALRLPMVGPKVWDEANRQAQPPPTRGGKRAGSGVKAKDGATDLVRAEILLTRPQKDKLRTLGGSVWVRSAIESAD